MSERELTERQKLAELVYEVVATEVPALDDVESPAELGILAEMIAAHVLAAGYSKET